MSYYFSLLLFCYVGSSTEPLFVLRHLFWSRRLARFCCSQDILR